MAVRDMTRRSLLRAGAGTLASATLHPATALAARGSEGLLRTLELGTLRRERTVALPAGVAVAGLRWRGDPRARIELRVRTRAAAWGPWTAAGAHGHGPEAAAAGSTPGDPLWIGGARVAQLRSDSPLAGARLQLVMGSGPQGAGAHASALPLAQPVLEAGPGQPPIIARTAWAKGIPPPRVAPEYGNVELAFVHHTENPNGYSAAQVPPMLRAIFLFHREFNGWNDIGYNFVLDRFGRIWEARAGGIDEPVVGAQAGGYNVVSSGVAVLGSYSGTPISAAARSALQRLLAWKLSLHGTPSGGRVTVRVDPAGASYSKYPANARVSLRRVSGHRDADSTDCPGDALYAELPAIRASVLRLAGNPVRATLALIPAVPGAGTSPQLEVSLATLAGAPVPGATVALQARTVSRRGLEVVHSTLAEGVTDAAGQFLAPASFAVGAAAPFWVRALCAGGTAGGAAVSRSVKVEPVAAATPGSAPAPTP